MKFLVVFGLIASLWNVCHVGGDVRDSLEEMSESNRQFTSALYSTVAKTVFASDNIVVSPLSVQTMLAVCHEGSDNATARDILNVLHLSDSRIKFGFREFLNKSLPTGNVSLNMPIKMFVALAFPIVNEFRHTMKTYFSSDLENVDLGAPHNAAKIVNEWAKMATHSRITDVIDKYSLPDHVQFVLIGAVYFKGDWRIPFDKASTSREVFYVSERTTKYVDMMHSVQVLPCMKNDVIGARLLEIPYSDSAVRLVIVLPLELDGFRSVETKLKTMDLKDVLFANMTLKNVSLSLPRITFRQSLDLAGVLRRFNVDMFDEGADFSRVTSEAAGGLSLGKVVQRTAMEFDEGKGRIDDDEVATEGMDEETFVVNHPFAFAVVSRQTGVVLLMGRYTGGREVFKTLYESRRGNFLRAAVVSSASTSACCVRWCVLMSICLSLFTHVTYCRPTS